MIVPTPEELKLRGEKRFNEMGKEVPAEAVNQMLGIFARTFQISNLLSDIIFPFLL